jgi:hypothetical protein
MTQRYVINASVSPKGSLETLSQREVQQLSEVGAGRTHKLFRQCALAIVNTGTRIDNAKTILEAYEDFEVRILQQDRGVRLELFNAPADAFVDGENYFPMELRDTRLYEPVERGLEIRIADKLRTLRRKNAESNWKRYDE